jgi:hypothetical protein
VIVTDELPIFYCWRCGAECDTDWVDISSWGDIEPQMSPGGSRCTNQRCVGRFSQLAHRAPSPQEIADRAQKSYDVVMSIAADPFGNE